MGHLRSPSGFYSVDHPSDWRVKREAKMPSTSFLTTKAAPWRARLISASRQQALRSRLISEASALTSRPHRWPRSPARAGRVSNKTYLDEYPNPASRAGGRYRHKRWWNGDHHLERGVAEDRREGVRLWADLQFFEAFEAQALIDPAKGSSDRTGGVATTSACRNGLHDNSRYDRCRQEGNEEPDGSLSRNSTRDAAHDADHTPLRGARLRRLSRRQHLRRGAQLPWRGGGRGRRMRGAESGRPDHLDAPRPRPLHRQGRRSRPHDGPRSYGRETGYCKGKGGSMHIADFEKGMLGANGIVARGISIIVGRARPALATELLRQRFITAVYRFLLEDGARRMPAFLRG